MSNPKRLCKTPVTLFEPKVQICLPTVGRLQPILQGFHLGKGVEIMVKTLNCPCWEVPESLPSPESRQCKPIEGCHNLKMTHGTWHPFLKLLGLRQRQHFQCRSMLFPVKWLPKTQWSLKTFCYREAWSIRKQADKYLAGTKRTCKMWILADMGYGIIWDDVYWNGSKGCWLQDLTAWTALTDGRCLSCHFTLREPQKHVECFHYVACICFYLEIHGALVSHTITDVRTPRLVASRKSIHQKNASRLVAEQHRCTYDSTRCTVLLVEGAIRLTHGIYLPSAIVEVVYLR